MLSLPKQHKIQAFGRINSMNMNRMVLVQLQQLISTFKFNKLTNEYKADKNVRRFSTWNLLQTMLYAHLTNKRSIRDICTGLYSVMNRWYHLGFVSVSRNNLSNSLAKRSHEVFEKSFYQLLNKIQSDMHGRKDKRFKFKNPLKAIDSTSISLCLSLCKWASFRSTKAGIKAHTMYDIKKRIPDFIIITEGRRHDHAVVSQMPIQAETIYVLDKGYLCFKTLENIAKNRAFFVTRIKSNTKYRTIKKNAPCGTGILRDDLIAFTGMKSKEYSHPLRLVRYRNPEDKKVYTYITNNIELAASTIASIYKSRWDIELFFKWIKQNLKVKTFIGTTENAVRIQIWAAAIAYLMMEYLRFMSRSNISLIEVFRIIGGNIFSDKNIWDLLSPRKKLERLKFVPPELQLDFGF
jgi:hypothetical protein